MPAKCYGYARVSTADQNLSRQLAALLAAGVQERDIVTDKASGKDFARPGYLILKSQLLRPGDRLVIKELDRLGRNYDQIKAEWRDLTAMGVDIEVLDTPMLNTTGKGDLEKQLIANIVFELLAYLAEKERVKIKARQAEGIQAARAQGKRLGRPATKPPANWPSVYAQWRRGQITAREAMRLTGLASTTFYKLVKEGTQ